MKHLKATTFLIAAALAAPLAAQQEGGRLDIVVQPEPPGLMLGLVQNGPTQLVAGDIYEGLLRYDTELQPMPGLAESWEISDDNLSYAFTIREGLICHDGSAFTPEDVVFTVERITDPEFGSPQLGQFNKITGAEVTGENEVTLTTDGAYPALLAQLVKLSIVPEHVASTMTSAEFNQAPVGSGPYVFENWDRLFLKRILGVPGFAYPPGSNVRWIDNHAYRLSERGAGGRTRAGVVGQAP